MFKPVPVAIGLRYLRAKRAEGGVSVMTWISLIGITLAVFALIATLAVRAGFRAEFVDTILGANAHVTVYASGDADATGRVERGFGDYDAVATRIARAVQAEFRPTGMTLLQTNKPDGWQTVPHVHVHVLPRHADDGVGLVWPRKDPPLADLQALAARIQL